MVDAICTRTSHRDIQCALGVISPPAGIKLCLQQKNKPQQKTPNKSNSILIKVNPPLNAVFFFILHCATLNVCALCCLIIYIIIWNVMLGDFSKNRCIFFKYLYTFVFITSGFGRCAGSKRVLKGSNELSI